ncbi:MAG TPA: class I SAM-dependent methyltransferase [Myxococcaceae bacterium]|nr:class I SAM-dependent methyltransferase [Myxococcaceae bacterium]
MARTFLPEPLEKYLFDVLSPRTPVQDRLRKETQALPQAGMQIGPDQGLFLGLLVRILDARRVVEVGTFTGYSALAMAMALPADGRIVCCDISEEYTSVARRYWKEAGVADRIDLRLGPARETLARLLSTDGPASQDLAFIDADKSSYDAYYEACLQLLRPGGIIAIDNVLWSGKVADPSVKDADTAALRALNLKVRDDRRVDAVVLTVGDGLTLARKKR